MPWVNHSGKVCCAARMLPPEQVMAATCGFLRWVEPLKGHSDHEKSTYHNLPIDPACTTLPPGQSLCPPAKAGPSSGSTLRADALVFESAAAQSSPAAAAVAAVVSPKPETPKKAESAIPRHSQPCPGKEQKSASAVAKPKRKRGQRSRRERSAKRAMNPVILARGDAFCSASKPKQQNGSRQCAKAQESGPPRGKAERGGVQQVASLTQPAREIPQQVWASENVMLFVEQILQQFSFMKSLLLRAEHATQARRSKRARRLKPSTSA